MSAKPKETEKKHRRKDWQINHAKIRDAMILFTKKNKRPPSQVELAELTGINVARVNAHFQEIDLDDYRDDEVKRFTAALMPEVLMAIYASAIDGRSESQKLFVKLAGWIERNASRLEDADGGSLVKGLADVLKNASEDSRGRNDTGKSSRGKRARKN